LQPGQTFPQKDRAEENVHQRRHEITEAGFDDATGVDRVNEEKPIGRDGEAAGQTINSRARRAHIGNELRPAPLPAQQDGEKDCRPNKSMRENLRGRNGGEQFPIDRDQSPSGETGDSRNEPQGFARFFGAFAQE